MNTSKMILRFTAWSVVIPAIVCIISCIFGFIFVSVQCNKGYVCEIMQVVAALFVMGGYIGAFAILAALFFITPIALVAVGIYSYLERNKNKYN